MPRLISDRSNSITNGPYENLSSNNIESTGADNTTRQCPWCGKSGHVRRSHRDCDMRIVRGSTSTNQDQIITREAPAIAIPQQQQQQQQQQVVVCPFCQRVGHQRRSHSNCGANFTVSSVVNVISTTSIKNIARRPNEIEALRNDVGMMNVKCSSCNALMWIDEKKSTSSLRTPLFQTCCSDGKAILKAVNHIPDVVANLLRNNNNNSKEFKANIRTYNSALSFTSMNAELDHTVANSRHGAYAFRIHGTVHHLISSNLLPVEGELSNVPVQPKFAQIYIFDSENELQNRMNVAGNSSINENTMLALQNMMHEINPFVSHFKTMKEISDQQPDGIVDIRMIFRSEGTPDPRRYNRPTASDLGVLIVGGDLDDSNEIPKNRDIVLRLKGTGDQEQLSRINEIHQFYDPLQYVLMFPFGDPGWHCAVKSLNMIDGVIEEGAEVTLMNYYSSRLMIRNIEDCNFPLNQQVGIHSFGKLFHQYIVDMYAKMEQQRLNFIRFNQKALRAAVYNGLRDQIHLDDSDMSAIGKKFILPSTFVGSPRFMQQLFHDAMNLVRRFGKPDLFITFTCNPTWIEITRELKEFQTAADRPDLCARVFNLKLRSLLDDIVKKHVLGKVVAYVYSIEFQKRGLPHCHMLFILHEADKIRTPEDINNIVSAEIPNPITHPLAHKTVTTNMIHGPCGYINPQAPCMKNGKCSKKYPYDICEETIIASDAESKLVYRRRPNNFVMRNGGLLTVDNKWVVPHNLYLAAKYDAHINVEICSHIASIKYVYKYVYKGHDRAQVYMGGADDMRQDEIKNFLDARYVSASEACWRLFSFPMHKEYPSSQRLDIHLENDQQIFFDDDDNPQDVLRRDVKETTLTAWFKYNKNNPDDTQAKTTLYPDFCEKYTFHKEKKPRVWELRKNGFGGTIGRIYSVSPKDMEKFYLRMLLYKIPGATCFADMKVYDGVTYNTYQATARAMGLLADDNEWSATMTEASLVQSPRSLRQLFSTLIAFSEVSDPFQLWLDHKEKLAEDYLYVEIEQARNTGQPLPPNEITTVMYGHCLLDINDILADHGYDLKNMDGFSEVFPTVDSRIGEGGIRQNSFERLHAQLYEESIVAVNPDLLLFNDSQRIVYETIRDCALDPNSNPNATKLFFVDGPGGTGKTFLFNALLDSVRRSNNIAIAVASSGTASLLLKGGRTAHSTFKIPLNVSNTSVCDMTPRSSVAKFIIESKLIVWDECSMISKHLIETVDRSFRDICKSDTPFGGRLVVFGGDFRQVLPIIHKASRSQIVSQCLNRANFWAQVRIIKLEINMRVQQALAVNDENLAIELQQFADFLLNVGEGKVNTLVLNHNIPSDFIALPQSMHLQGDNLLNLLKDVYFDIASAAADPNYFVGRAILTPKNRDVSVINNLLLDCLPGRKFTYFSNDKLCDPQNRMPVQVEYLNTIESGSLPPHKLEIRIGSPIMVIRNIQPAEGVCNGTRLIVKSLTNSIIEAVIATGPKAGDTAYIPRIKFICSADDGKSPHDFVRIQFPIRLAFAMTINKSQGQTLLKVGAYLPSHVFGHGQLYVAMSRVRTPQSIRFMIDPKISKVENEEGHYTHNIVYKEVFL